MTKTTAGLRLSRETVRELGDAHLPRAAAAAGTLLDCLTLKGCNTGLACQLTLENSCLQITVSC